MGASAVTLVALLELLVALVISDPCIETSCDDKQSYLDIYIRHRGPEPVPELSLRNHVIQPAARDGQITGEPMPAAASRDGQEQAVVESLHPPADTKPVPDWDAIARETVKDTVDDYFRQEGVRAAMWRQTGSVMFQDDGKPATTEVEPIIADVKFKRPVGVLGLGITIGGCFFGIPIAGIPVEERTAGPTIFYCIDQYE
ncbi:MAG TPA: hypothetical protein PKK10_10750 [Woeseiaceae bacterium]|nr:hypothetical protein [Woeseiaceae bacterium]